MLSRTLAPQLLQALKGYPAVLVAGPRQSGKTTFVRHACPNHPYVNLESPLERANFRHDPLGFLARYPNGAILDEVQNEPEILSYLQVRIDEDGRLGQWILTGSQQIALLRGTSQSLAGRIAILDMLPFSTAELRESDRRPRSLDQAILRGGYPPLYDEARQLEPSDWLENYLTTFVQRDVGAVLEPRNKSAFDLFLRICATRTAQEVNQSRLAAECGADQKTVARWLEVLEACYVIRLLRPYHRNFGKRLIKRPKLHFLDSGLACRLLHITDVNQVATHPLRGALFESWCFGEVIKSLAGRNCLEPVWYWRTSDGIELDFILDRGTSLVPIEVKARMTPDARAAKGIDKLQELNERDKGVKVERGLVFYGGAERRAGTGVDFIPWNGIAEALETLG